VSRGTWKSDSESSAFFAYRAITLYGRPFQVFQLKTEFVTFRSFCNSLQSDPTTPFEQRLQTLTLKRFRLVPFRSPLLRESLLFSFPEGTEMFHFPSLVSTAYVFSSRYSEFIGIGFPIRKSPDQSLFAAPRGLSQLTTSFITS
jgi:hypothetical protein